MNNVAEKYKEYVNSLQEGETKMSYYEFLELNSPKKEKIINKKNKKYLYFGIFLIMLNAIGIYQSILSNGFEENVNLAYIFGSFLLAIIGIILIIKYKK